VTVQASLCSTFLQEVNAEIYGGFLNERIIAKSLVDGISSDLWLTDYKVRRLMDGSVQISPDLRPGARRNEFLYSA
jgi:hypothetical protein